MLELVGLVVEVHKSDKYVLFTLDDSTECIQCLLWRPTQSSNPTTGQKTKVARESQAAYEVKQEMYQHLCSKVVLGQQLKIQGKPHRFQGVLQVKCFSLRKLSNTRTYTHKQTHTNNDRSLD